MLLTNRLNFFDKKGNEINLQPDSAVEVSVIDPTNSGGYGAVFLAYTNRAGNIAALEIVNPGANYDISGQAYLRFTNSISGYVWDTNPADLSVDPLTGKITGFTGLSFTGNSDWKPGNELFPYPAITWKGEIYFDIVSTGLIETQEIFVLEKVVSSPQTPPDPTIEHNYPRASEGPINELGSYSNTIATPTPGVEITEGVGSVSVRLYNFTGNITGGNQTIYGVSSLTGLVVGMAVEGTGIPAGSFITEIISPSSVKISKNFTQSGVGISFNAYQPHGFVAGMKIRIGDSVPMTPAIEGVYEVTLVSDKIIYFSTPDSVGTIPLTTANTTAFFRAAPVWRGRVVGSEQEIFLFTVEYNEDYPVITKTWSLVQEPIDGDNLTTPDVLTAGDTGLPAVSNSVSGTVPGYQYRQVSDNWTERLMQFSLGFSADTEGSFINLFALEDITFPYAPSLITQIALRGETEAEDPRLGRLLENFGRDVNEVQELILRDSDVYESLPDYRLLNKKRREMLLQGEEIWPYMGSYKGLVNIINWFGYYDLRIKEYWLNVNKNDIYYGKYKQIQIPFQLEMRGKPAQSVGMVPSKTFLKTNKFGLFYDLNRESGVIDENGIPVTIDAFQFSNEEVLIKLFALKQYLANNFLPLNAKIVDIVGEGVYYERYAANTWNDRVDQRIVELTREVDFLAEETRIQIIDTREYDTSERAYVYEPGFTPINNFYSTYTVKGSTITGSAAVLAIPQLSLTTASGVASPSQLWGGQAFVKGLAGSYLVSINSNGGSGYSAGDIITLGGGTFANPIRVEVTAVSPGGVVTGFDIVAGLRQGSRYLSLPEKFYQTGVLQQDLTNNLYYAGAGLGFQLDALDIQYEVEGVKTTTIGKGYPINDPLSLVFYDPVAVANVAVPNTLDLAVAQGPLVGYFNNGSLEPPLTNEPNVPVSAPLDLTLDAFELVWNEVTFSWEDLQGFSEAVLKTYADVLPAGSGGVDAVEIISQGDGYTLTPSLEFFGGDGTGATGIAKISNGKLQLLEVEVTSIVPLSPTTSRVNLATAFPIPPAAVPYSINAMVTGSDTAGNSIAKPSVIFNLDLVGGTYFDITSNFTSAPGNFNVYVHEGAVLSSAGSGYVDPPEVKITGGYASTLYTWDEIARGNFYEMEWRVDSEPGTAQFTYSSGRKSIDELETHRVKLPYKGFYRVEVIVYDTDNNWVNEIKRYYAEAFMPEACPVLASRFIGPSYKPGAPVSDGGTGSSSNIRQLEQNCADTWDEAIFYWDEFWGRWINPIKTWSTWNDCDLKWDTLGVTPLSRENNWTYPVAPDYLVYRVSAYDASIGNVTEFRPKKIVAAATNASNVLQNCSTDGYSNFPLGGLQIGDLLFGPGIPAGTTVTSIDFVNNVVTLSAAYTLSDDTLSFYSVPSLLITAQYNIHDRPLPQSGDVLFFRRDDDVFQVVVPPVSVTIPVPVSLTGTVMTIFLDPLAVYPSNFASTYSNWEGLFEVENTVVVKDDLYTTGNGKTLTIGQFITLEGDNNTPLNNTRWGKAQPPYHWGIPVIQPLTEAVPPFRRSGIVIDSGFVGNTFLSQEWVNGQVYKYRNNIFINGNLKLNAPSSTTKTVTVRYLQDPASGNFPDPTVQNWGNKVWFFINDTPVTLNNTTTADVLNEIRPGFTIFTLVIGEPDTSLWYVPRNSIAGPSIAPVAPSTRITDVWLAYRPGKNVYEITALNTDLTIYDPLNTLSATTLSAFFPVAPAGIVYVPDGDVMYVSETSGDVYIVDASSTSIVQTISVGQAMLTLPWGREIKYASQSKLIYLASNNSTVICIDADSASTTFNTVIASINVVVHPEDIVGLEYDPVRNVVWTISDNFSTPYIIDADRNSPTFNTVIATSPPTTSSGSITYNPGNDCMIFNSAALVDAISCVPPYANLVTGASIQFPPPLYHTVLDCAFHPGDGTFWSVGTSGTIFAGTDSIWINNNPFTFPVTGISPFTADCIRAIVYIPETNSMWMRVSGTDEGLYEIPGEVFDNGKVVYEQHFRTIDGYLQTVNDQEGYYEQVFAQTGTTQQIVVEAVGLDGKKMYELDEILSSIDNITRFGWIEYKYSVFPTRTHSSSTGPGGLEITMDFNTRPIGPDYENSVDFPANTSFGTGWYYDHGISQGNFSQEVINVGEFLGVPGWTIVTVDDPNHELYRCDSTFLEKARDFDEDYAETRLGTKNQWKEYELPWKSMCSQTWDTLDWTYTLNPNFKFSFNAWSSGYNPSASVTLQFNNGEPLIADFSPWAGSIAEKTAYMVNMLNNNFFDRLGTISIPFFSGKEKNEDPGLSLFDYSVATYPSGSPIVGVFISNVYTWGNPLNTDLFGDDSGISGFQNIPIAKYIQPGWEVTSTAPGVITLGPSSTTPSMTIGGSIPWIPCCIIHANLTAGSKVLKDIVGYEASLPQGGWLWDPASSTVIGEFGPGYGAIEETAGFVTQLTMDTPAATTANNVLLEVYPKRSGIVQFLDIFLDGYYIIGQAKNPGAFSLGYLTTEYDNVTSSTSITFFENHETKYYDYIDYFQLAYTLPLGNYYNWVQEVNFGPPFTSFYGTGSPDSILQFTQQYRHIQNFIKEGGTREQSFPGNIIPAVSSAGPTTIKATNGGWYPSETWGPAENPFGLLYGFNNIGTNAYKPFIEIVEIRDESGNNILTPTLPFVRYYLVLDGWYDGDARIYADVGVGEFVPLNLSAGVQTIATPSGTLLTISIKDVDGDGTPEVFDCVLVDAGCGVLGRNATYFTADYSTNPLLIYDYTAEQLENLVPVLPTGTSSLNLSTGMVVGQPFSYTIPFPLVPADFRDTFSTRIQEIQDSYIKLSSPQILGTGNSTFYAYTPLNLAIKMQPIDQRIWSYTRQAESMRLPYESSFNSAFTWEDSTISVREKKIPAGASVLLSADAADIAGKTGYLWSLYYENKKLCSVKDPNFIWLFNDPGLYDVELTIEDTNGNVQTKRSKNFIEVYLPES
jgi:hypothetical protein